jgi:hypothetical protein
LVSARRADGARIFMKEKNGRARMMTTTAKKTKLDLATKDELLRRLFGRSDRSAERLMKLPDVWQQRLISGEITASQARELAAWNDEPAVASELDARWKRNPHGDFENLLRGVLYDVSCGLSGYD